MANIDECESLGQYWVHNNNNSSNSENKIK